ncbi:MAG: DUF2461 domain-containing protein [Flavobacteriaceae bacterium]
MQIPKSTLKYLTALKKNNNREWFHDNKPVFKTEQIFIKEFHQNIINNLNKHDKIDKYKLFRIYRDVRFSKDKTPYQPHFAASFSRTGAALRGGYYLRIRPGESFIAGGFWDPNKEDLLRIRKEFEMDASDIRAIISAKKFVSVFGNTLEGAELKSAPRDFDKTHPNIDLIRKKGFIAVKQLSDKDVLAPDFIVKVDDYFKTLRPFFDYMSEVLTTNLNGESLI